MQALKSTQLDDKTKTPSSASTTVADNAYGDQSTSRGVWGPNSNGNRSSSSSGGGQYAQNPKDAGFEKPNTFNQPASAPKTLTSANPLLKNVSSLSRTISSQISIRNSPTPAAPASGQALPEHNQASPTIHNQPRTSDAQRNSAGSRSGLQPNRPDLPRVNQVSNGPGATESNGDNPPAIKMKRTGQNFPLSSANGLPKRNSSNSPIPLPSSVTGGGAVAGAVAGAATARRAWDVVPQQLAVPKRQTPVPVPKIPVSRQDGSSQKLTASFKTAEPLRHGSSATKSQGTIPDTDPDDIIYEAVAPAGMTVDAPMESSSDYSDSQSDDNDDETGELDSEGERPPRQRFQAPDQEEDGSEEDDSEDDDATSVSSSSGESSIANELAVDLPSASIQHQELFPSTILHMAEPGRPYTQFLDRGITIKAAPAMFPVGYSKSTIPGFPWMCSVRSCRLCYKTSGGIANHARFTHKKAMFNDNMDGTVSLVGSYSQRNQAGRYPPVIVSKRPLDPKEPPMREPAPPAGHHVKVLSVAKVSRAHQSVDKEDVDMVDDDADSLEPQVPPTRPQTADRESSEQMWQYIKPYLSVHKSMPYINWARHIAHLRRQRDIQWNVERNKDHPFRDSHARDVAALIVQVTGVESPKPCDLCAAGRGPFIGCVQVSPEASDAVRAAVLSCANCYYHCGQSGCSLCTHQTGRKKRDVHRSMGKHTKSHNIQLLTDVAHGKSSRAAAAPSQALSRPAAAALETSAKRSIRLYQPSEFNVIEKASSERTYKVIKTKDGGDHLMCGALIPEKYDLDHTVAGYPWICSVRSCRRVFKKVTGLGSHFVKAHPGVLLNDNLDGTLSQVGYYNTPRPGVNGLPALVISNNTLDPEEPPMPEPSRPGYVPISAPRVIKPKGVLEKQSGAVKTKAAVNQGLRWKVMSRNEVWDHVRPYLPDEVLSVTSDPRVLGLLDLPRNRNLQMRPGFKARDDHGQIVAIIIYVTGEEYRNGSHKCTTCVQDHSPFPHCITLKKGVLPEAQSLVSSCANCIFLHKKPNCSVKGWKFQTAANEFAAPPIPDRATAGPSFGTNKRPRITDSESEGPLAIRRRSGRLVAGDEGTTMSTERSENGNPLSPRHYGGPAPRVAKLLRGGDASRGIAKNGLSSALIEVGQINSDDLLEMEDWEVAPGRIRATGAPRLDNIAFSKAYLESNQAVRVSSDVTMEVKTIKSGASLELAADPLRSRYCMLATGKIHISIVPSGDAGQREEFSIGPLGVVKIVPGATTRMLNKLYIDATLNITSVAGD